MIDRSLRGALCAGALALSGCVPHPVVVRRWPVMATYATATVVTPDPGRGESAIARVRERFDRVNDTMSNWSEASELSRLNAAARARAYRISDPDLAACLAAALDAAALSGGAFDPTVGPLMALWGFRPKAPRVPAGEEIEGALRHVGASKVAFDRAAGTIRFLDDRMELDLGGIAKGCALDLARREAAGVPGVEGGLLDLGGQLASWGRSPDGPAWTVGVRDPEGEAPIVATLVLRAWGTVASSSDAEQAFVAGGRCYGHIMDSRTGRPADTDVLQSTAIDPSGTTGDALSTALFVTGSAHAAETLRAYPSAEAVLIVREGGRLVLLASSSLRGRLAIDEAARHRFTADSPRFILPAATMTASVNP